MRHSFVMVMALIALPSLCIGQIYEKRSYSATRIENVPVIDGLPDDDAWTMGTWETGMKQYKPVEAAAPSQNTEFMILYDDNSIYVLIKAYDTAPDSIVNRITRRDDIDGDQVGIIFDSYHDLKTGFCFFVSSAGVKQDEISFDDGMSDDDTFDPIWYVRTRTFDWGWCAEMRIPLTQLRFSKEAEQAWGLQVERSIYRNDEVDMWQLIPRNASGNTHLYGNLTDLRNIKPRKQFDLTPYGVMKLETYAPEDGNPWADGRDLRLNGGLDSRIGLSNNTILSLTVNPDFGQVEADPSEVNLTAFETFFQEKRPFFVESTNITDFNLGVGSGSIGNDNLFYSRRIGRTPSLPVALEASEVTYVPFTTPILGAAKITGKSASGTSFGFVESMTARVDRKIYNTATGEKRYQVAEPLTNYSVGRIQKDFNRGKTIIGGMLTNTTRSLDSYSEMYLHKNATTGGIDFTQYFGRMNWIIRLRTSFSNVNGTSEAISRTQLSTLHNFARPDADYVDYDPERKSLTGTGGSLMAGKLGGNLQLVYIAAWKTPSMELNDIGYMQVADRYLGVGVISYNIYKPHGIFLRNNFAANLSHILDFGGTLQALMESMQWNADYKNLWETSVSCQTDSRQISNTLLRGGPSMTMPGKITVSASFNTNRRKKLSLVFETDYIKGFNNYRESKSFALELQYRPSDYLSFSVEPLVQTDYNELQFIPSAYYVIQPSEKRYLLSSLHQKTMSASIRIEYNVTPDLSVQYWGQPFICSAKYNNFKIASENTNATEYNDRFILYTEKSSPVENGNLMYNSEENIYYVYEDTDLIPEYSFVKPDFSYNEFLSNLVVKWEFLPGSSAYLVWSQTREYSSRDGIFDMPGQLSDLFSQNKAYNVFLLKVSFRFGLR